MTSSSAADAGSVVPPQCNIGQFLCEECVAIDLDISSRKRLFESLAGLISGALGREQRLTPAEIAEIDAEIFDILHSRERLGCTGLGQGIAVPHGRYAGLLKPAASITRLKSPIDYDAPDGEPVWLAICLLVPDDADRTHLNLLSDIARRFSNPAFTEAVGTAVSARALCGLFQ